MDQPADEGSLAARFAHILHDRDDPLTFPAAFVAVLDEQFELTKAQLQKSRGSLAMRKQLERDLETYKKERDTWTLIQAIYDDRATHAQENDPHYLMEDIRSGLTGPAGAILTERQVWDQLDRNNTTARELQILVDWLESITTTQQFFKVDATWNNTKRDLNQRGNEEAFNARTTKRPRFVELDPDAPCRGLILDDNDKENEVRLLRGIWMLVRAGKMEDAQLLCRECGQHWRAASLSGDDPAHDTTLTSLGPAPEVSLGNQTRALWTNACLALSCDMSLNTYERAIYAALSGNLSSMLGVCQTWIDNVWARAKSALFHLRNTAVEEHGKPQSGIEVSNNGYTAIGAPLTNIQQIFDEVYRSQTVEARKGADDPYHIVQTLVVCDKPVVLVEDHLTVWAADTSVGKAHLLRLAVHMSLFLGKLDQWAWAKGLEEASNEPDYRPSNDHILMAYIEQLKEDRQYELIALYASHLSPDQQVVVYSEFLRTITQRPMREHMLQLAELHQLDVHKITQKVAERTATSPPTAEEILPMEEEEEEEEEKSQPKTTIDQDAYDKVSAADKAKISAIEWLTFDAQQRAHAIRQANSLLRSFLLEKREGAARELLRVMPEDAIPLIKQQWAFKKRAWEVNAVREYLALQRYLDASNAYKAWNIAFHSLSTVSEPPAYTGGAQSIAWSREMSKYRESKAIEERAIHIASEALKSLYAVIVYPKGWLKDDPEYLMPATNDALLNRQLEIERLRQICIRDVFFMSQDLLFKTGQHAESFELAERLADENMQLYQEFDAESLRLFLQRVSQSAMKLVSFKAYPPLRKL
eukprot:TRINITY_DN2091_c3_g1_i1.p1 TRINITY_DN2091_c3_g1~~TRINITY_DN2091_c3_g1_i1.p1  ORF type:complete len:814 (-),score=106.13 TRINITY_DN2091_c3_g1_i1:32-2473(-)